MSLISITSNGATKLDIAWAAGLFEGEGCFTINSKSPACILASSDKDVLERFVQIVGIGSVRLDTRSKIKDSYKDLWVWRAAGSPSSQYVIALFWDFLGSRRKDRAREVLLNTRFLMGARKKSRCAQGHSLLDDSNVYLHTQKTTGREVRHCRKCREASAVRHYLKKSQTY